MQFLFILLSIKFFTELELLLDHIMDCTVVLHLQGDTQPNVCKVQQTTGGLSASFQIQKICITLAERSKIFPAQSIGFLLLI